MAQQSPVTVRAQILDGRVESVTAALSEDGADARGKHLLVADLPGVHFARMFIVGTATLQSGDTVPASLIYMADVDGSADRHLSDLVEKAAPGVDKLFGSCVGYPERPENRQRIAWLREHTLKPAAYYVHTVGRTVARTKDETRLYECVGEILDQRWRRGGWRHPGTAPSRTQERSGAPWRLLMDQETSARRREVGGASQLRGIDRRGGTPCRNRPGASSRIGDLAPPGTPARTNRLTGNGRSQPGACRRRPPLRGLRRAEPIHGCRGNQAGTGPPGHDACGSCWS